MFQFFILGQLLNNKVTESLTEGPQDFLSAAKMTCPLTWLLSSFKTAGHSVFSDVLPPHFCNITLSSVPSCLRTFHSSLWKPHVYQQQFLGAGPKWSLHSQRHTRNTQHLNQNGQSSSVQSSNAPSSRSVPWAPHTCIQLLCRKTGGVAALGASLLNRFTAWLIF